jgi:hypothetical protein
MKSLNHQMPLENEDIFDVFYQKLPLPHFTGSKFTGSNHLATKSSSNQTPHIRQQQGKKFVGHRQ